ncbi:hypothetical protein BDV97DRAFT_417594 [Delphinella strobiligena]|nr:hypothetical protein BDV97DRAFT_417594 [Delphinella strobiligena]
MLQTPNTEPINWPSEITYLRQPTHSPSIPQPTLQALNTPTKQTAAYPKFVLAELPIPNPAVRITPITTPTHPAWRSNGLFTTRHHQASSFILPYIGHMHTDAPADTDITSSYDISLDRELGVSIDAAKAGNEARFVNDYRGIRDRPNAEFRDIWVKTGDMRWERWIGIFVLGEGKAGLRKGGLGGGRRFW